MANTNKPNGLWPVGHFFGRPWKANPYYCGTGVGTAIYKYDPVAPSTTATTNGLVPTCGIYSSGNALGVAVGFSSDTTNHYIMADPSNLTLSYRAASTAAIVFVIDDPFVIYEVQATGTPTAAEVNGAVDITVGTGSTVTGISGAKVGTASAQTATCKILRVIERGDNELGAYARFWVMLGEHHMNSAAGT